MHNHSIRAERSDDSIHLKQAVLGLLVCDHPGLWSLAEIDRALKPGGEQDVCGCHVEDVLADLYAAGLIHRCGDFVFATQAAHAAERINA